MRRIEQLSLVLVAALLLLGISPEIALADKISRIEKISTSQIKRLQTTSHIGNLKLWLRSSILGRAKLGLARNPETNTKRELVLPNGQIIIDPTRLVLFKGKLVRLSSKHTSSLAASTINSNAELLFIMPHRITKRVMLYSLRIRLSDNSFRLRRIPASFLAQFGCAEHERGHSHATLASALVSSIPKLASSEKFQSMAASTQAAGIKDLELATLADADYYSIFGSNSNAQIASLLNAVSTIYEAELSLKIVIVQQRTLTSASSLNSSDANTLLTQFDTYLASNPFSVEADIRHLFTGKDMNSGVIGIAYVPGACDPFNDGANTSLSQYVSSTLDYVTVAHEFGHNLYAGHDTALPATIMYPSASSSQTSFSTTSRNQISTYKDSYLW